jgi:hypothetical protein
MAFVVHYVGGPRDGENETCVERPPLTQRQWLAHGRAPVSYTLLLVEVGPTTSALVYAASWLPDHVVRQVIAARLRYCENDSTALTRVQHDHLRRHLLPSTLQRNVAESA